MKFRIRIFIVVGQKGSQRYKAGKGKMEVEGQATLFRLSVLSYMQTMISCHIGTNCSKISRVGHNRNKMRFMYKIQKENVEVTSKVIL